jgi:glycopeptide antibiotics resistance protein
MLSFLLEVSTSFIVVVVAWPIVAALFALPVFIRQYCRYNRIIWSRLVPTYLFIFYLLGLVILTQFPLPNNFAVFCAEQNRPVRVVPFMMILDMLSFDVGDVLQVVMNVVFFIPLGVFATILLPLSNKQALLLGMIISLLIEATQGTALWGAVPCRYRVADVDDLILNVIGTWLGIQIARSIPAEVKIFD